MRIFTRILGARKTASYHPSNPALAEIWGLPETGAGEPIGVDRALTISAVSCASTLIANAGKVLPLFTYQREGDSKSPAREHPVYRLLHDKPNPRMTPSRFKRLMLMWALLWGNGRAEIERDGNHRPIGLWPIHPSRCQTYLGPDNKVYHEVAMDEGPNVILPDDNVLHVMGMSQDGLTGMSVVTQARESLGITLAAETYGAKFFANDAMPRAAIKLDEPLSEVAWNRLRDDWQKHYGGDNRHRPALLEGGADVVTLGMPNEDAQFLETRTFQIQEVARWFVIPPHKLKELTHATYTNVEHLEIEYVGDAVVPWLVDFEEECDRKLFTPDEQEMYFTEFLVAGLLRGDTITRNQALEIQRRNAIINANEWRAKENMNPQEGDQGEAYLVSSQMVPVKRLLETPVPVPAPSPMNNEGT